MAAADLYLKLDGVTGESVDSKHEGEMELASWSWSIASRGFFDSGKGGARGKAVVGDLVLTKQVDQSSPQLWKRCQEGTHIETGQVTSYKAGGDGARVPYIKIELKGIFVSSVQPAGSGDMAHEQVVLNFKQYRYVYTIQDDKGGTGKEVESAWNLAVHETA